LRGRKVFVMLFPCIFFWACFLFLGCFLCLPFASSLPLHNTNLQLWQL
jgi:hypothetical protein